MQLISFSFFRHAIVRFATPSLIALAALLFLPSSQDLLADHLEILRFLPYTLLPIAVVLGQLFNQGKTSVAALLMLVSYYIIQGQLQTPLSDNQTNLTYMLLAMLLPLNLLNLQITQNRRLLSRYNITYMGFILSQLAWGALVIQHFKDVEFSSFWQQLLFGFPSLTPLPAFMLTIVILASTVQASTVIKRNQTDDQALFICTLYAGLTFVFFHYPLISSTAFSIASILLLLNLITCSHELAYLDQLTTIPGRRALETDLKHLGRTYTIAMLDIDHFKKFNDSYGHQTGDNVLQLVASFLSDLQGNARVYRYGGEEFTILFRGKEQHECRDLLEGLRQQIANFPLILRQHATRPDDDTIGTKSRQQYAAQKHIHVTVSIGFADSYQEPKPENVIKAADKALYHAKTSGRNRISNKAT